MSKKRHHPIRNFFIFLLVLAVIIFAGAGIIITDFTDNTPDYLSEVEGMEITDFLAQKAEAALNDAPGLFDDFKFLFTEHDINNLLATVVPNIHIPCVNIKSIYVNIDEEDNITAEAPFSALFYTSCAKVNGFLSETEDAILLKISEMRINLLTSESGIVKAVLSEELIKEIEKAINDAGVSLTMWKDGAEIYAKMTISDICKTIVKCSNNVAGVFSAALVGGALTSKTVDLVVNENGLTGIIIHKSLLPG